MLNLLAPLTLWNFQRTLGSPDSHPGAPRVLFYRGSDYGRSLIVPGHGLAVANLLVKGLKVVCVTLVTLANLLVTAFPGHSQISLYGISDNSEISHRILTAYFRHSNSSILRSKASNSHGVP